MQPTRLTLFVLIDFLGVAAGVAIGAILGFQHFRFIGLIAGIIFGFFVGHFIGILPTVLANRWMFRSIERSSTGELKKCLNGGEWNFYQTMSLLQLAVRKENIQQYLPQIVAMLESEETLTRVYGWDALRIVFTDLSRQIQDFNPRAPVAKCRGHAAVLRASLSDDARQQSSTA